MVHQPSSHHELPSQGSEVPFISMRTVTRDHLRAYAEASGDHNPIHLDEEVAKANGLPGVIAHGMLTAGIIAERGQRYAREALGKGWHVTQFQTKFRAMVFPGDELEVGGVVSAVSDREVRLDLKCRNSKGETNTLATVVFSQHWEPV